MKDLTSLGYPEGYHLGFSFILWNIFIVVVAALGIKLYLNAKKSDLINVKEMLRAKGFMYICTSIQFSLIQVAVHFPEKFLQFYFFSAFLAILSFTFYIYYWEKNLTSIKRIPTISVGASTTISIIVFIISLFFLDLPSSLVDFLLLTILLLVSITFFLYIYLIYLFSRNVKGISKKVAWIWICGMILGPVAFSLEHPPGVKFFPEIIVLYFTPIILMSSMIMAFYGVNKMFSHISSYYAQTQKCAVHRGKIEKGNPVYYCPSCGIVYCETCFKQVIKRDGCWNLKLLNETIKESHFLARNKEVSYEEGQAFINTYFDHPNTVYLIALYDGKLIGHMFCIPRFEDLLIHTVNIGYLVHSDYRRKGIGSILMERLLDEVRKIGNSKILTAEVAVDNYASWKLLMKYDFKEFGRLLNGIMVKENEYVDLLSFSKHL